MLCAGCGMVPFVDCMYHHSHFSSAPERELKNEKEHFPPSKLACCCPVASCNSHSSNINVSDSFFPVQNASDSFHFRAAS